MERDVQLCVVRILDMIDAEGCDHIGDRCDMKAKQDRPKNGTLRYPKLEGSWNRLLITDLLELEPLFQVRPDPIQRVTVDSKSELQSMQESTGVNRIESGREIQEDQNAPRFRIHNTAEIVKETQKSSLREITATVGRLVTVEIERKANVMMQVTMSPTTFTRWPVDVVIYIH